MAGLTPGLLAEYFNFKQGWNIPNLRSMAAHAHTIQSNIDSAALPSSIHPEHVTVRWTGKLKIVQAGEYPLYIVSPGAVQLWIDSMIVVKRAATLSETGKARACKYKHT